MFSVYAVFRWLDGELIRSHGRVFEDNAEEENAARVETLRGFSGTEATFLCAFMNLTRINQKIMSISGRKLSNQSVPVLRKIAGNRCCRARNIDAAAMNSAKHIRQRCRAIRAVPEIPLRTSMRRSPTVASSATEPMKKYGPGG